MPTLPGYRVWEMNTPATVAASPVVTGWYDTTGYTTLLLSYLFTNSTGTTALTIEGSFDGAALDTDITYAAPPTQTVLTENVSVPVATPYIRFRIVQATADATRTKVFVQARA
ncbi:MAG TPA: hypothetical protein VK817_17755 [Trebonia sp.]|jgi:hypothetical protein|nr:hypothetical protein [Trebonia sp.]